ncbi:hypothetical protein [Nocardia aurantia]|uniref:PIN domain-containing protein n=1 Tax=Nocardia aurantia TaxID=2585199 RepID=A0A7K0DK73_9NOCA|nr:hypothetical protein [Nocardia aurantia]MQY26048.1 hypothetical protein [Nocardia aurantia]
MPNYIFPDNTVLCNFGSVLRIDLLEQILDGNGRWTEAVAAEAEQSSAYLGQLRRLTFLGAPIEIDDPKAIAHIEHVRCNVFGGLPFTTKHLGEAQTCYVLQNYEEFTGSSLWVTDDRDAADWARRNGLQTRDTMDLMSEGVLGGLIDRRAGFTLLHGMRQQGNWLRLPRRPDDLG